MKARPLEGNQTILVWRAWIRDTVQPVRPRTRAGSSGYLLGLRRLRNSRNQKTRFAALPSIPYPSGKTEQRAMYGHEKNIWHRVCRQPILHAALASLFRSEPPSENCSDWNCRSQIRICAVQFRCVYFLPGASEPGNFFLFLDTAPPFELHRFENPINRSRWIPPLKNILPFKKTCGRERLFLRKPFKDLAETNFGRTFVDWQRRATARRG